MSAGRELLAAARALWRAPWRVALAPPAPAAGVEVRPDGLRWRDRRGGAGELARPDALTRLDGLHPNASDEKALAAALAPLAERLPAAPVALLLPAAHFRCYQFPLDSLPRSHGETDALLRFRLKRLLPYRPEAARVAFRPLPGDACGLVAMVAYEPMLRQWETAFAEAGRPVAWVLPAPLAALAAWEDRDPSERGETRLLVDSDGGALSLVAASGGMTVGLRAKAGVPGESPDALAAREVTLTAAWLREKLQLAAPCAIALGGLDAETDPLASALAGAGLTTAAPAPAPLDWIAATAARPFEREVA